MPHVIYELLELEELDGTEGPPVLPVDRHLQLPRLVQLDREPLVPGLAVVYRWRVLGYDDGLVCWFLGFFSCPEQL